MIGKRGGLTQSQIIGLFLLLIGLAAVFSLIFLLDLGGGIDKKVCHQSIITRSTFNYGPIEAAKETFPLKCNTEKVCVGYSKDSDCSKMVDTPGNEVRNLKVSKKDSETREEIIETLVDSLYDCHSMLGEGNLNFMPRSNTKKNYCFICSRISFDKEDKESIEGVTYEDIYGRLKTKKTPSGETYLEYLYPPAGKEGTIVDDFEKIKGEISSSGGDVNFRDYGIDPMYEGGYAIIVQISPKATWTGNAWTVLTAVGGVGLTVLGVATVWSGLGVGIAATGIAMTTASVGTGLTAVGTSVVYWKTHDTDADFDYSYPAIYPYETKFLREIGCYDFLANS